MVVSFNVGDFKVNDRVVIVLAGTSWSGKHGTIVDGDGEDYEWAVLVDGHSQNEEDTVGFNSDELAPEKGPW